MKEKFLKDRKRKITHHFYFKWNSWKIGFNWWNPKDSYWMEIDFHFLFFIYCIEIETNLSILERKNGNGNSFDRIW